MRVERESEREIERQRGRERERKVCEALRYECCLPTDIDGAVHVDT